MDMPLAAMFTIAMLAWYAWHESAGKRYLALFYIFMGLAMLAKGPVAPFLAAVIVLIFAAAKSDYRLITRTLWIPGVVLFCVVTLPWYIAVQLRNPEFFEYSFSNTIWRVLVRTSITIPSRSGTYLPVALLGLVPWTMFVAVAVVEGIRDWSKEVRKKGNWETHLGDPLPRVSSDLVGCADCIFLIFGIEAAGVYSCRRCLRAPCCWRNMCGATSRRMWRTRG